MSRSRLQTLAMMVATTSGRTLCAACRYDRSATNRSIGKRPGRRAHKNAFAPGMMSGSIPAASMSRGAKESGIARTSEVKSASHAPCQSNSRARLLSRAPKACAMSGSRPITVPMPTMATAKKMPLESPTAPSAAAPRRPTTAVSTTPMSASPAWAMAMGTARRISSRSSVWSLRSRVEPVACALKGCAPPMAPSVSMPCCDVPETERLQNRQLPCERASRMSRIRRSCSRGSRPTG